MTATPEKSDAALQPHPRCPACGSTTDGATYFSKGGYRYLRCDVCKSLFLGNPPTPEELERIYSFDSGYHQAFDDPDSSASRAHRHDALTYLAFARRFITSGRVLDVGCSAGFFLDEARKTGFHVTGLELSPDTAALARTLYGLEVVVDTLDNFRDQQPRGAGWDLITLWDVIEHVPDPVAVLQAAFDLLVPGGRVILLTPRADGLFPRLSAPLGRLTGYWPHAEPPHHLSQFSSPGIQAALTTTGFTVENVSDDRIPLAYTFGSLRSHLRQPWRLAYSFFFAPAAWLGPLVSAGDRIFVVARKPAD